MGVTSVPLCLVQPRKDSKHGGTEFTEFLVTSHGAALPGALADTVAVLRKIA